MQPNSYSWDSTKAKRREQIATLLTLGGIDPGQPEVFRTDKTKGYIRGNVAIARLDALLTIGDEDFIEEYAEIIKQADALTHELRTHD
jgi:hypothetical protein